LANPDITKSLTAAQVAAIREIIEANADNEDFLGEEADFESVGIENFSRLVCLGKSDCPYTENCFFLAARAKAKEAKVVIVNHALLATDLVIRRETDHGVMLLNGYDRVVLDESHEFAKWVPDQLETQISEGSLRALDAE